jgi:hypothetical protein
VLFYKDLRRTPNLLPYLSALSCAFLLFCFYLKWQPWGSRLHLPLFVLFSAFISVVMSTWKYPWLANTVMMILIVSSLPFVLGNSARPLIDYDSKKSILKTGRFDQYFANRSSIKESYLAAADFVNMNKCKNIGLLLGENDWEYPLWVLVRKMGDPIPRIEHIQVNNRSGKMPLVDFTPCILLHSGANGKLFLLSRGGNPYKQEITSASSLTMLSITERATILVSVKNLSDERWTYKGIYERGTNRVGLGFHWLDRDGKAIQEGRALLPNDLDPGSSVVLKVSVQSPSTPGDYKLRFSMVREHVAWFYDRGASPLVLNVKVISN